MEFSNSLYSKPTFGMKFVNNKAFREVVDYAVETSQLQKLDTVLNRLNNANKGDVLIIHGTTPTNQVYSSFRLGTKSVQNLGAKTPAQASFNAILELDEFGRKFRKLVCGDAKSYLKPEDLIKKYTIEG